MLNEGALLPLGGEELSGGYKGYGLMFLVEILCGLLADSNYGPNIRTWQQSASEANLVMKISSNFLLINLIND